MLKSKKIVDWLYDYSLYFIIGALLLVIIAIEPSFVRVSNFTTILTQSATKVIYACGIAGIIVLGGTDLALGREVGLAAVVAASAVELPAPVQEPSELPEAGTQPEPQPELQSTPAAEPILMTRFYAKGTKAQLIGLKHYLEKEGIEYGNL